MAELALEPRHFSLGEGTFPAALRRIHLAHPDGNPRTLVVVAIAWVPLFVGALSRVVLGEPPAPILYDISVHARLLVAIPLFILAERLLETRTRDAVDQVYEGNFADRASVDRIIDRAERLRDSRLAVLVMLAAVVLGGLGVLTGLLGATGIFSGVEEAGGLSFARVWYTIVSLPMTQFLVVRWVWHWAVWSYIVLALSRLELATISTHPDKAAGIGFLSGPLGPFSVLILALASTSAAGWATRIYHGRMALDDCIPLLVALLIGAIVVGTAPLFAYVPQLYRARWRALDQYSGLALDYMRGFHRKWIVAPTGESILGSSDVQSMADMINSYSNLERVRPVPFGLRPLLIMCGAVVVPMIPLAFTAVPVVDVLEGLGKMMVGIVS